VPANPIPCPPRRVKTTIIAAVVVLLFALLVWSSDRITMQGERTIYTIDCQGGSWNGPHCTGHLAPGARYAFRASVLRKEVIYWTRGSNEPSGTYSDCTVTDRDNWSCKVPAGQKAALANEMKNGRPSLDGAVQPPPLLHEVAKWKWWAIRLGITLFSDADA
jgi:hypothetical protein